MYRLRKFVAPIDPPLSIHYLLQRVVALAETELVRWRPASKPGGFCKHCGVATFAFIDAAEWNDGEFVSINVCALDNLDAEALAAIPITYVDGLHDTWQPLTSNTRYL